jgi:hypothetical protein
MRNSLNQSDLINLSEVTFATNPVAVLRLEPDELPTAKSLNFREGFDDLDYLVFATLLLSSGREVTLVRHTNAPNPGTEICMVPEDNAIALTILESIKILNLTKADLSWTLQDFTE